MTSYARCLLIAVCLLACAGCGISPPVISRPPDPPADLMEPCPSWPSMAGEGDVTVEQLVDGIARAKLAYWECAARTGLLQRYIREVR